MNTKPTFIHDTKRIISVNADACALFRCDPVDLIDRDMLDLIPDPMGRSLAALRLRTMRETGHTLRFDVMYPFMRFDGSRFLARLETTSLGDGQFQTVLIYEDEE